MRVHVAAANPHEMMADWPRSDGASSGATIHTTTQITRTRGVAAMIGLKGGHGQSTAPRLAWEKGQAQTK